MQVLIACQDRYLSNTLASLVSGAGLLAIRTAQIDRVKNELKQPDRCVIIDMAWVEVQRPGMLKQLVNIGKITSNQVICICPNEEEDLKVMARLAGPAKVFIRFDINTPVFKEFLKTL